MTTTDFDVGGSQTPPRCPHGIGNLLVCIRGAMSVFPLSTLGECGSAARTGRLRHVVVANYVLRYMARQRAG